MSEWFVNGEPADSISIVDRAVQYGDGLFETVAIRDGQPRLWSYHVERLRTGCARLDLEDPGERMLARQLNSALEACTFGTDRATVKLIVTAGQGPRGYRRAPGAQTLLVGVFASPVLARDLYRDGVKARICQTRLAIQPQLAGIKTLNRLEQVLARREWQDESTFEGLMLDTEERLICGTMSNVFIINGQSLATPAITRCGVSGVMRRRVLALMNEGGMPCEVRDIEVGELEACDGVMITNSQFGVLPIRDCGQLAWRSAESAEPFMALLRDDGIREDGV